MAKKKTETIKAYKVFDPDWTCRGFQFEVGKKYHHKGKVSLCESGFHACRSANDCFEYYSFDSQNKVAEVLLSGTIDSGENKDCAEYIEIVREISWHEVLELINTGKSNTGRANTGDGNTGDGNTGNRNAGYGNTGNRNAGYGNTGYGNTGNRNAGNRNAGDGNTGNRNAGYGNTGYGNICDRSSGIFCSNFTDITISSEWIGKKLGILCFNKPSGKSWDEIEHPEFYKYKLTEWISADSMTDVDKLNNPKWETADGFLKKYSYQEMWSNGWAVDYDSNKKAFFNLPNFDLDLFQKITGIDVSADYERLMK